MRPFHLVNVTWGDNHTGLYLDVSLPTQLLPNNLPALAERPGTIYTIYAPADDAQRIRTSAAYRRLCEMVSTRIVEIELGGAVAHEVLTECQKQAIREAETAGAALVFLAPDTVLADGAFATLARLADEGKKAVMVPGVRLTKESFVAAFLAKFNRSGYGLANVSPRDLVELALDHLHPTAKALFWPAKVNWPSNLYWSLGREGFICRCFHLHPFMVVTDRRNVLFASTIDGDYVEQAGIADHEIYIVPDSDELAIFEISSVKHNVGLPLRKPMRAHAVGRWGAFHANRLHRRMFAYVTRIHSVVCSPLWDQVQAESDDEVRRALRWSRYYCGLVRAISPALPALRVLRQLAGGNTPTGRAMRWCRHFAVRLVKRGPNKALRLSREFLALPMARWMRGASTSFGRLASDEHRPVLDQQPARDVDLPRDADGGSALVATAFDVDPTVIPPPSYTRSRAEAVYGEAFRRAFEYLKGTGVAGDIAEFGTLHGYTARLMATLMVEMDVPGCLWLYDSFTGLPADMSSVDADSYEVKTNKTWWAGAMALPPGTDVLIRRVLSRVLPDARLQVVKGYFNKTLPKTRPSQRLALVHVDCDLYTSARYVLDQLLVAGLLQDGCLILCDDYNCNRGNPQMGERRAMSEAFASQRRFSYSPYFSYGWHGQAFLVHDREAIAGRHAAAA